MEGDVIGISYLYTDRLEEVLGIKSPNKFLFFPVAILFVLFFFGGIRSFQDGRKRK